MLKPGSKAPAFSLLSDRGGTVSLKDLKGTTVVLYFYPKDDTSGCTVEACEFKGSWKAVQAAGATVLGVSPDNLASHRKFRKKYRLPFPLLSDPDHAVAMAYAAWGEKSMYGRKYMGILRSTVVIDEKGRVLRHFEKVRPKGHAAEVLAVIHADAQ
jgi:thioredoxin-dependent peroxiredoxin